MTRLSHWASDGNVHPVDLYGALVQMAGDFATFTEATIPGTTDCTVNDIQCMTYTYDANGNITKIVENASTSAKRVVEYAYDDLNRLIAASSSDVASDSNFSHTYSYNAIGNLLVGPAGTYVYADAATSSYANPHAPIAINSSPLTYDQNGNMITYGTSTFSWNYRNELTASNNGSATSTYRYDREGQRVKLVEGGAITIFPSRFYSLFGAAPTLHVFVGGALVATVGTTGNLSASGRTFARC